MTKAYRGIGMDGPIAHWYARNTAHPERHAEQAGQVARRAPDGAAILEVAPGPGYTAIELAKRGYRVTGLDISGTLVDIARRNAAEAGVDIEFRHGNASGMPFADDTFEFLVCCAAFKNFSEPKRALREMRRVLRPGGAGLIMDLRRDVTKQQVKEEVAQMRLGPVNRRITEHVLGSWLPRRAYTKPAFEDLLADIGFTSATVRATALGLEVDLRK